jgi:hypothetical protein
MTKPKGKSHGAFGSVKGKFIARTIDETNEVLANNLFQQLKNFK